MTNSQKCKRNENITEHLLKNTAKEREDPDKSGGEIRYQKTTIFLNTLCIDEGVL